MWILVYGLMGTAFIIEIFVLIGLIITIFKGKLSSQDILYGIGLSLLLYLIPTIKYLIQQKQGTIEPFVWIPLVLIILLVIANKILGMFDFEYTNMINVSIFMNSFLGYAFLKYFYY